MATRTPTKTSSARRPKRLPKTAAAAIRAALGEERAQLTRTLANLEADYEDIAADAETETTFDEENSEGATVAVALDQLRSLQESTRTQLAAIDAAEARLDDGSYGTCEGCDEPIPVERLEAIPTATLCVTCKAGSILHR